MVDAYSQLVAEGFLSSRHGSGTRVATVEAASAPQYAEPTRRYDVDFAPGSPDLSSFPRTAWLRALRAGLAEIGSDSFGYVEPQGLPAARVAIADYLRRTRGVQADPQHIVLCSGATQAVALLARALQGGELPFAMEDPGFWLHRMVLRHNGIAPVAVPIDEDGLDVAALTDSGAQTVLTTPAHQSPTGVVLSAARRTALVEWARAGHLVIEDDYDAEYRYDRAPVGALQGIAPDRVVYIGSTSKTLAPGLRIGWMVLPPHLVGAIRLSKGLADTGSSVMDQIAFAALLTTGGYDRHLRQMRRRYLTRRNALLAALARHLPQAGVLGAAAGVHLTVRFPDGYPIADAGPPCGGHAGQRRTAWRPAMRTRGGAAGAAARLRQPHRDPRSMRGFRCWQGRPDDRGRRGAHHDRPAARRGRRRTAATPTTSRPGTPTSKRCSGRRPGRVATGLPVPVHQRLPRPEAAVHLRSRRTGPRRTVRHAIRRESVSRWRPTYTWQDAADGGNVDDAAQSRRTDGLRRAGARDPCDAPSGARPARIWNA